MALDTESFQAEVDTALDKMEVEADTAAGTKDAEVVEDTVTVSEDTASVIDNADTDDGPGSEADREEAEAKKVLGDETAGETEDATTSTVEKTPVQFDDRILARAVACGVTLSEARDFPDNGALTRFVDNVEANLTSPEVTPIKETAKKDEKTDLFAGLPELSPDEYSSDVLQHLERNKEVQIKQQERLNAIEARADSAQASMHDAGEMEMRGWFDTAVADLGDDYKEDLGEGAFGTLAETSKEFASRNEIAGNMALLHDGHTAQGRVPPSRDELFAAAVKMVLPEASANIQKRKLEGELEQQSSQHIQRARGTNNKSTKTPEDETAALITERFNLPS